MLTHLDPDFLDEPHATRDVLRAEDRVRGVAVFRNLTSLPVRL